MAEKTEKKKKKKTSSKPKSSGEEHTFDQKTMQEFKEAFSVMDCNKDGIIDKQDLKDIFAQLGEIAPDSQIDEMIKEAPGQLNFTMFLTLFGDRLTGTDTEDTILGAFKMFDPKETGFISEEQLKKILDAKKGDPFDEDELRDMYKGKPPIAEGQVDYKAFAHLLVTGAQEEMDQA